MILPVLYLYSQRSTPVPRTFLKTDDTFLLTILMVQNHFLQMWFTVPTNSPYSLRLSQVSPLCLSIQYANYCQQNITAGVHPRNVMGDCKITALPLGRRNSWCKWSLIPPGIAEGVFETSYSGFPTVGRHAIHPPRCTSSIEGPCCRAQLASDIPDWWQATVTSSARWA